MKKQKYDLIKELLNYGVLALWTLSLLWNQEVSKKIQDEYLKNLNEINYILKDLKTEINKINYYDWQNKT